MARNIYGASGAAQVVSLTGAPTLAAATVKTARTGGTTVTDVLNMAGAALGGIVTPDSRGQIIFQGPDLATATYWLDFGDGGPRWAVSPVDLTALVDANSTARELAQFTSPSGVTAKAAIPYISNSISKKMADALDSMVTRRFASVSARDTAFPSPADGDRVYRTDLHAHQTYRALGTARWVTDPATIFETTLASNAAGVSILAIPQEWRNLRLVYRARANGSPASDIKAQRVGLQFNNDTATNYSVYGYVYNMMTASATSTYGGNRGGTAHTAGTTAAVTHRDNSAVTTISSNANTAAAAGICAGSDLGTLFGGGEITIMDYTSSTSRKPIQGNTGFNDNTGAVSGTGYSAVSQLQGGWSSNAAITRIDISAMAATGFIAGSYFALMGW